MTTNRENIAVIIITKNSGKILEKTLFSINNLASEIIIVDDYSTDNTKNIAEKHKAKFFQNHSEYLGDQRLLGLNKAKSQWLLILDSDEIISTKLSKEIKKVIQNKNIDAYYIPYVNHFFSIPIKHGGENYKALRLFRKNKAKSTKNLLHEQFIPLTKKTLTLKNQIYHYSYRSFSQIIIKFTNYAKRASREKLNNGETSSIKKLTLYPIHMFWSRFIESKGYKDGAFRLLLDIAFAYMEFLIYFFLFLDSKKRNL